MKRLECNFYKHIPLDDDSPQPVNHLVDRDVIYNKDARSMAELPDNSVHMVITSPPYNAGKEYEEDLLIEDYLELLTTVWRECYRVLVKGGRIAVNCPLLVGRTIPVPISAHICQSLMDVGFRFRTIFVWDKGWSSGKGTAWGSWLSPANPYTFDTSELIYVFSKGCSKRLERGEVTITKDDFLLCTRGTWSFATESDRRHPAPFPVELPRRLIEFYTYKGEVILDPFMGSGTTAVAAIKTRRFFVGYELQSKYIKMALKRINSELSLLKI